MAKSYAVSSCHIMNGTDGWQVIPDFILLQRRGAQQATQQAVAVKNARKSTSCLSFFTTKPGKLRNESEIYPSAHLPDLNWKREQLKFTRCSRKINFWHEFSWRFNQTETASLGKAHASISITGG